MEREAVNLEREVFCRTSSSQQNSWHLHQTSCTCLQKAITNEYVDCSLKEVGVGQSLSSHLRFPLLPLALPRHLHAILHTASRSQESLEYIDLGRLTKGGFYTAMGKLSSKLGKNFSERQLWGQYAPVSNLTLLLCKQLQQTHRFLGWPLVNCPWFDLGSL